MTRIVKALDTRYLNNRRYQLIDEFIVETDTAGTIEVEAGRITDFNSQPQALWSILPPMDYDEAAVAHDKLYQDGQLRGEPITRTLADRVHRELLTFRHAPAWKVVVMYRGLRWFGWRAWNRYRAQDNPLTSAAA